MFFEEYSSEAFSERLQSLPLQDFVQIGTAQMDKKNNCADTICTITANTPPDDFLKSSGDNKQM